MSIKKTEKIRAFGFVVPALLWTVAFFVIPFAVMFVLSLAHLEGRDVVQTFDLGNYVRIFSEP